jgi:hypothetical protein
VSANGERLLIEDMSTGNTIYLTRSSLKPSLERIMT